MADTPALAAPARRPRWGRIAVVGTLAVLLVGRWLADHTADRLWAASVGVDDTHSGIAGVRLMMLALAFGSAAVWCVGNVYLFYRSIGSVHVPRRVGNIEFLEAVPRRYLLAGAVAIGLLLAVIVSHDAGGWWATQALLDEHVPVGVLDPILNRDLGYYLFELPWYRTLHGFVTLLAGTMLAVVMLLYAGVGAIRWTRRRLQVSDLARMHLAGLFAAFALALVWGYRLEPAEYVAGVHGVPLDATLVDVRIPVARLLSVLALLATGVSVAWLWVPSVGMMAGMWTVLAVVSVVGHYALPVYSSSVRAEERVSPPEIGRATAEFEGLAYGLVPHDSTSSAPGDGPQTLAGLRAALRASPVWDPFAVTQALNAARPADADPHVRFLDASLGLYAGSRGQPVPVYVAAREVDFARARDAGDLTWEREHTTPYGHTRGFVAVAAGAASASGAPLFVPSLEPADSGTTGAADVRQESREMFFSPAAGRFSIVAGAPGEYVGVPVGGFARRLALAWALQSPRLVSSDLLTPGVLVLWERQVSPRLARYAPFAEFGTAYPVFARGRLYWVASGYVSAETFPLARAVRWRGRTVRYLRAGLVGIVDAHSGTTSVYLMPGADPLSAAWASHAPEIIKPLSDLPADLAVHLRYPDELFDVQVGLIRGPVIAAAVAAAAGTPAVRNIRPPSADQVRRNRPFWWSGPWASDTTVRLRVIARFEPEDAATLSGLISGTLLDGVPFLEVLRFAQGVDLVSPSDAAKRLADTRAPAVGVTGPRRAVVLGSGVLAVQSSYATTDGPPRLSDVVVQWGPLIGRGNTLSAAVENALTVTEGGGARADWRSARRWFDRMEQARQRGDWTAFGRAYDALRRMLTGQ